MTRLLSSPSVATPTQRNRRLLLTLPAAVALPSLITACGGGADLSYTTEQALYFVGEAITPNTPQLSTTNPNTNGHKAPTFSVWPPLPAGLTLNAQTGVISGTPTKLRRQSTHTVIATNNRGIAETKIRITVTGRGAWSAGAATQQPRHLACIAPLPSGKVLVAGGSVGDDGLNSAEIYDPVTMAWASAGSMAAAKPYAMCVPLRNGKVLVFSQYDVRAELYDPATNTWAETGSMGAQRLAPATCLLPDGSVLVIGGLNADGTIFNTIEKYNPGTGAWSEVPNPMLDARFGHAAVLLPGDKNLLLVGGRSSIDSNARAESYALDGGVSKFISAPATGPDARYFQAVMLDDGSVLVVSEETVSWRFYPRTSTWTTSSQSQAREFAQVIRLADGRVLRAGGSTLSSAEIYNPDVNVWTAAAPMALERVGAATALLPDGRVLMVNGSSWSIPVTSCELYTP